jgi:Peptidase propeptide and YPEB domain
MLPKFARRLLFAFAVTAIAAAAPTMPATAADGCLPPSRAPYGLSNFLGQIREMTGGGSVVRACLREINGRLIYQVTVQVGGQVMTVNIDANTGAPQ